MLKLFVSFILVFSTIHSEAAPPRCGHLYSGNSVASVLRANDSSIFYAEALDELNAKYNSFLFKESALKIVNPDLQDLTLLENIRARYRARKLRKILIQLHDYDQYLDVKAKSNTYALEKIAVNLEKLTFLMDESVVKSLASSDRAIYRQLQHSLLSQGLSQFLFTKDLALPQSQIKTIISKIMTPFKKIYLRWLLSPVMMPHLDGAVIPYEVIEKVIWQGYENSREDLAPYLKTIRGKNSFNVFASTYNWMVAAMILSSTVSWVYTTSIESYSAYTQGEIRATQTLETANKSADVLANKNLSKEYFEDTLKKSIEIYREKRGKDPSAQEVEMLKQLVIVSESGQP